MSRDIAIKALSITAGQSVTASEPLIAGVVPVALITPAVWTAAAIGFLVQAAEGEAFYPLFDNYGAEVLIPSASISTSEARRFVLDPKLFLGVYALRVRSGTNAAAVNQVAAAAVQIVVRHVD